MRAAVITRPGGPEVLEIQDRVVSAPGPNEILVRVRASALNRADLLQRQGNYPAPPGAPPDIPGLEFAGEVERIGAEVRRWKKGDRVFGVVAGGGNAEMLVTDADTVARVPENLSWIEAAAVPEAFITASDALAQAEMRAGETVLIHAAGSGVGLAAIQLVRAMVGVSIGTARTADKLERAREYGLDHAIEVAGDPDTLVPAVMTATADKGVNVTLDLVGGDYLPASIRASAAHGRIVLVGTVAGRTASVPLGMILGKRLTLRGTVLRARSREEKRAVTAAFEKNVVPLIERGTVRPTVDRVYPLAQIAEAHQRLASNATFGKVVLEI